MNARTAASLLGTLALVCVVGTACTSTPAKATAAAGSSLPDPRIDDPLAPGGQPRSIVLAGGCFWGMEEVFAHVKGVAAVTAGYAGGSEQAAHYEMVETGTTGHAESARIVYNPSQTSLGQLLEVFFLVAHDPTQRNAQLPDVGPQYRSVVFYGDERQEEVTRAYVDQLNEAHMFSRPIATDIVPLAGFYPAEEYHQHYAVRHPRNPYIVAIDLPKLETLKQKLPAQYASAIGGQSE